MKKLDKNKIIGYKLEYDSYSGYYIDHLTVYDLIWWWNHNNGKRPEGGINWKRDLTLVPEEVFELYKAVMLIRSKNQQELRDLYYQFYIDRKLKYEINSRSN